MKVVYQRQVAEPVQVDQGVGKPGSSSIVPRMPTAPSAGSACLGVARTACG